MSFLRTLKFSFSNNCDVNHLHTHTRTHARTRARVTMFNTLKEKYAVITYATKKTKELRENLILYLTPIFICHMFNIMNTPICQYLM